MITALCPKAMKERLSAQIAEETQHAIGKINGYLEAQGMSLIHGYPATIPHDSIPKHLVSPVLDRFQDMGWIVRRTPSNDQRDEPMTIEIRHPNPIVTRDDTPTKPETPHQRPNRGETRPPAW